MKMNRWISAAVAVIAAVAMAACPGVGGDDDDDFDVYLIIFADGEFGEGVTHVTHSSSSVTDGNIVISGYNWGTGYGDVPLPFHRVDLTFSPAIDLSGFDYFEVTLVGNLPPGIVLDTFMEGTPDWGGLIANSVPRNVVRLHLVRDSMSWAPSDLSGALLTGFHLQGAGLAMAGTLTVAGIRFIGRSDN